MAKFTLPKDCYSVKMESDGTRYRPNSSGTIEVTNRRHVAEMRKSSERKEYDMIKETSYALSAHEPDRFCEHCLFNNVRWVSTCSRCGAALN